jgi:hypothetical protein
VPRLPVTALTLEHALREHVERDANRRAVVDTAEDKAQRILDDASPEQRAYILDEGDYVSARCPRRSGKTWANVARVLYRALRRPGHRAIILSLTLKSTRQNYWSAAPAGLFAFNRRYDLGAVFNHTASTWVLPNGSYGRLAGAETKADLEHLRGADAEVDDAVIDECKSFPRAHLDELIQDILEPGLLTRNGRLALTGTPGLIPSGTFYEATCLESVVPGEEGQPVPTCRPWDQPSDLDIWALHTWTLEQSVVWQWQRAGADPDNPPRQWLRALRVKAKKNWADDHPTWRREYLGEWTGDQGGMVYAYAQKLPTGEVSWAPEVTRENPAGLPPELGPWRLVMGVDLGFEDDFAAVLAGYSERVQELRHVAEFKSPHLNIDQQMEEILRLTDRYGWPDAIVADKGALGKLVVETMVARGIPMIAADKHEKFDHIALLNADLHSGRIKILPNSELATELLGLQWDLSKESKEVLVRTGKLREDKNCPNHLTDAFLYLWRYSYHHFARAEDTGPAWGTTEWHQEREAAAERYYAGLGSLPKRYLGHEDLSLGEAPLTREGVAHLDVVSEILRTRHP